MTQGCDSLRIERIVGFVGKCSSTDDVKIRNAGRRLLELSSVEAERTLKQSVPMKKQRNRVVKYSKEAVLLAIDIDLLVGKIVFGNGCVEELKSLRSLGAMHMQALKVGEVYNIIADSKDARRLVRCSLVALKQAILHADGIIVGERHVSCSDKLLELQNFNQSLKQQCELVFGSTDIDLKRHREELKLRILKNKQSLQDLNERIAMCDVETSWAKRKIAEHKRELLDVSKIKQQAFENAERRLDVKTYSRVESSTSGATRMAAIARLEKEFQQEVRDEQLKIEKVLNDKIKFLELCDTEAVVERRNMQDLKESLVVEKPSLMDYYRFIQKEGLIKANIAKIQTRLPVAIKELEDLEKNKVELSKFMALNAVFIKESESFTGNSDNRKKREVKALANLTKAADYLGKMKKQIAELEIEIKDLLKTKDDLSLLVDVIVCIKI